MEKDLKDRTKTFAIDIIKSVRKFPKGLEYEIIGRQLIRSATSVGANTRSAYRGRSKKEFVAKIGIVVEEADESIFWLEIMNELNETMFTKKLMKEASELTAIFNSIKTKHK